MHKLEGCDWVCEDNSGGFAVEIRWKGPKISLGSFRRTVKRNCTREESVKRVAGGSDDPNDAVLLEWDEEFCNVCSFSGYKDNVFHPWEINFAVLQVTEVSFFFHPFLFDNDNVFFLRISVLVKFLGMLL